MKTQYFNLRETAEQPNVIGVIKSINGNFDLQKITEALESYFDEEVLNVSIMESDEYFGTISVQFNLESREETETVEGEETFLYF